MKTPLKFSKYSGNGNDFVILDNPAVKLEPSLISKLCDRHFGVGADGVLVLQEEKDADGRMRIYNADGGEAEMCANGLRCLVTYIDEKAQKKKDTYLIKTMNSQYRVTREDGAFAIEMSEIKDKNLYDLSTFHEFDRSYFVNTGVPHLVFSAKKVKDLDLKAVAPRYRHHSIFPNGSNVSFLEVDEAQPQTAYVRTFERGVEDETHSCGTGLTAAALALNFWLDWKGKITLRTLGGTQIVKLAETVTYSGEVTLCFHGEFPL